MSALAIGVLSAVSIRFIAHWNGPWQAEVDFDLTGADVVPSGPVVLTVGGATLAGTVDPSASGRQGLKARARVVGGGNGWGSQVPALAWHNDGGVLSTTVLSATAALVGETVVDQAPVALGSDYVRAAGAASRVFGARSWWVDATGVTQVGSRPSVTAPADLVLLEWDPYGQVAQLASDTLLLPGLQLTNTLFDGTMVVRDIEQTFDVNGARATAVCTTPTGVQDRLGTALQTMIRQATGVVYARPYRYRVVSQGAEGRLTLQAVKPAAGIADTQLLTPWYGVPGFTAQITPGTIVLVVFLEGDPSTPVVVGFDATAPIEVDASATAKITLGAPEIDLSASTVAAGGTSAVAMADAVNDWAKLVTSAINALAPGTITPAQALACASTTLTAGPPKVGP